MGFESQEEAERWAEQAEFAADQRREERMLSRVSFRYRMNRCPRCQSTDPHLHPAMQFEGEVEICAHEFHLTETPSNKPEYIEMVLEKRKNASASTTTRPK